MNPPRLNRSQRFLLLLAGAAAAAGLAMASPLPETTAVQKSPDAAAPVIAYLKAGSEAVPANDSSAIAPPGWMAVTVAGPFEGYVLNHDLTKSLDVKTGSPIYLAPDNDAAVLTVAAPGEKTQITGLHGRWTQVRIDRGVIGYINLSPPPAPAASPVPAAVPVTDTSPVLPAASGSSSPAGRDVTAIEGSDPDALPKNLEGRLVSTRTLLPFHHPYAWQLVDDSGHRRAYLDISRLMLTDRIERYINHQVQVHGMVKPLADGSDIVIAAESLQLK